MKNKINILSILSIFLILATVTIGTVSAATPAEIKQDSRLKALETSVSNILTRLVAIESKLTSVKTPPYNAVFGKFVEYPNINVVSGVAATMTINLPVTSNVYLSASGFSDSVEEPYLQVDNGGIPDWSYGFPAGGFTIARVVTLGKGIHKINLHVTGAATATSVYDLTMSAVASEKGNIDCGVGYAC